MNLKALGILLKMATASEIAAKLNLNPHPEGGFYSETFRDTSVLLSKSQLPPEFIQYYISHKQCDTYKDKNNAAEFYTAAFVRVDKVDRPVSSCIYFLLPSGSVSRLHRIPCAETWHFYLGEPITVLELDEDGKVNLTCLGPNLIGENQQPQYTVKPNVWFGAFPTKDLNISPDGTVLKAAPRDAETHYSLVGCTCAPAFHFQDFELAKRSELISRFPKSEPLISLLTFPD
ncbi:hypothetical protein FEM48_Zijuj08G0023600 [Ziziphus jujuba var. spinosa]|uniref:DUF985 domain-containing protein n=1 Tax=Ziziphus jujuba var. spinosa TaxID=714518 RepID=A0A978UWF2_ZIZJJ|nr:hypothetical protein FEM48_Zijuj08G0023600 [Ziziphus jujuba var. spinosa]